MLAHPVSRRVNSPTNNTPDCIEPVEAETVSQDAVEAPAKKKSPRQRKKADDSPKLFG
jgi:hypothetical protein